MEITNDPIERLHNFTNARIRAGAKSGKYWVLRSEEIIEKNKQIKRKNKIKNLSRHIGHAVWGGTAGALTGAVVFNARKPSEYLALTGLGGLAGAAGGVIKSLKAKHKKLTNENRKELINRILETTFSSAIGGYSMPMMGNPNDPAFGGRNRFTKKQLRFAVDRLLNRGSSE